MNSNILLKLIKFGIGFVLFIPLYIGGSFYFPFIFPKIWLFQLTTEIILFLYIVLALIDARYRPKWNLIIGAVGLLTAILIITSFTGVDAFRSFWGNTERMSGVIAWFHFVAFAVILSSILKTEKDWRKFFGIAVFVSVLEFFYVLAQSFSVSWVWMPGSQMGTIGNTDLLGSYAIFGAFFALYLWSPTLGGLRSAHENKKFIPQGWGIFWASAFFANIITLYLVSSRGALLGFGIGLIFYLTVQFWQKPQIRKTLVFIVLFSIVLYGFFWLMRDKDFVKNTPQLTRIVNASFKDDTVQQRFTEWGIAWNAFKARSFFGFGPNNYLYLHNTFLNPKVYELHETNFDRAHNAYLDYASMSGILGLLGYVFLIGALFWIFCPPAGDLPKEEKTRTWVFAALIVAYAVQSFFVFDSPASFIVLFLTIGFASYKKGDKQIINHKIFNSQTIISLSFIAGLLLFYVFWQVSVKPAVANNEFTHAFNNPSLGVEKAFDLYKKAVAKETLGTTEFRNQYNFWLQKNLSDFKPEERIIALDFGINELEKEVKDHPMVFSYLNLGQLYNYKARGFQDASMRQAFFEKAASAYDKALGLSPNRLEVYYSYLQLSFDTKNYDKGIELMKRAVSYAPNYWQVHWYLGFAYIAVGNDKEATVAINEALAIFYKTFGVVLENNRLKYDYNKIIGRIGDFAPKQEILGAVNPYIKLQMWPELLLLYLSAEEGDPGDIQIHQSLVLVYRNLGLTEKMNGELKIIRALSENQSKSE